MNIFSKTEKTKKKIDMDVDRDKVESEIGPQKPK